MSKIEKKVAIVTGASRGIGREVALRLAKDGFAVVVNFAGSASKADEVVRLIESAGGKALAVQGDVSDSASMEALFDKTQDQFGHVDVVVHSAGVMALSKIADQDLTAFDKVINTNLRGTFIVLGLAAKRVNAGGRIVTFSTSVIAKSFPGYGAYIASKAGAEGLMHVLANELRGRNIAVNAVAPGPVATELFLADKTQEEIERLSKVPPLERLGQPEDIANLVSFLAGPEGGWVNGQVIRSNGGFA
ncbi:SDR family oxidoreductase [Pseudomonas sp. ZM23]|jgi:3-oxoacyl-[acyl-carrier protein] reductase|uniref:SDR family oxidoreductase n=2 Tax=Pseudomonadota TaxID=1224 RepID=A0AAW7T362_BURVI|nr:MULTISPECIES: SDR family oxidoreductase [Pseudomonadota]MCP8477312.1 SDR family oxidoreductase [Pseudomonas triclosanedens]HEJ6533420.1 SDR family oxidoreductase [Pseudomonas aeruginosa]AOY95905.1 3-ketoacyl-ACP reductase [Cupriavidus sp. USMAA2-4]MCP8466013.1 SDR family oxidoreductase [Pseudomonas triclosanedens]MDN7795990.1 SDR family oxidoreductase [Burkholderia vietnamiensis]